MLFINTDLKAVGSRCHTGSVVAVGGLTSERMGLPLRQTLYLCLGHPPGLFVCSPASHWALTEANIDQGLVKALPLCSTTSPWTSVQNAAAHGQSRTTHFSLVLGGAPGCNRLSSISFEDNAIKMWILMTQFYN